MIEASHLTKRYGRKTVVDDLSFTVRPGVVTGFLGPNGAGKSTTMRMILGLDRPTAGSVTVDGHPYAELPDPLRVVGGLLDAKWVHPNRSARNHLRWMAAAAKLPASRVDEVLDLVGLTSVADRRAGQFSLGMAQRLGIAGALLGDPHVLLFDEPVNGLDPEGILWIRRFMHRLAAGGRTVLVSSHLLSEMALTAQELIVIGRGRLVAAGTTAEFVDGAAGVRVLVRSPDRSSVAPILTRAGLTVQPGPDDVETLLVSGTGVSAERVGDLVASVGATLHELAVQRPSLEEAFMRITGDAVEYHADGVLRAAATGNPAGDRATLARVLGGTGPGTVPRQRPTIPTPDDTAARPTAGK